MLRKIADLPLSGHWVGGKLDFPCQDPEHDPPSLIRLDPGIYEHTCPGCGKISTFVVDGNKFATDPTYEQGKGRK